jgi:spore coat polysaccharide biosynthesis protein SpsF
MDNHKPSLDKVVALVQARMKATRLPGKVLLDISGKPMLARVVERTRRSQFVDQVVVATSTEEADDPIELYCDQQGFDCFRGSLQDVLDRCYQAAKSHSARFVVRITADCPVIDPLVIDQTLDAFFGRGPELIQENVSTQPQFRPSNELPWDFAANRLPPPWKRTFPIGLDTEVCTFNALETAWGEADQPHQREHVMPFLYENDQRFRILLVNHEPDFGSLRWTVDTQQDLNLLRAIYSRFGGRDDFSWLEMLEIFNQEPDLAKINAEVAHKHYRDAEKVDE